MNDNMKQLLNEMHPTDRNKFDFDISNLDWEKYLETYVLGTRQYILKEDPKTLEKAKKQLRR